MNDPGQRGQVKPFALFLQEINRGRVHAELSDAMADVIGAVVEHGKKGSLALKIDVKPEGEDAISVSVSYAGRPPQPSAKPSLFFADAEGHISRQRLNQPELPLQGIDGGADQDAGAELAAQ